MIDFKKFAQSISERIPNVWTRPLSSFSKEEIEALIFWAWNCPDKNAIPPGGWEPPRIENSALIIGFNTHPKYRWWTPAGQSVMQTLRELNAPQHVIDVYTPDWFQE